MSDNTNAKQKRVGKKLPAARQSEVAAYVAEKGEVTIAELSDKFAVSFDTVRRDLAALDEDGILIRTHGGAVNPTGFPRPDTGLEYRMRVQAGAKDIIGKIASRLVDDNTAIIINSGTTALALARHLSHHRDLTIATNNILLPTQIAPEAVRNVYIFGGAVRLVSQASYGPVAFSSNSTDGDLEVRVKTAFIGVGAVCPEYGYSTSNLREATMMRAMMSVASEVVILADTAKLNQHLFAKISDLSEAHHLVTDAEPPAALAKKLKEAGVRVHYPR